MTATVVMRVTMHLLRNGRVRYYAAYTPFSMEKATISEVHPDSFWADYVRWPKREYRWLFYTWAPPFGKHLPNSKIVGGVCIDRNARRPSRPQDLYTNEQAMTLWRHYAHLLYSTNAGRG